jgi:hypothetical protein
MINKNQIKRVYSKNFDDIESFIVSQPDPQVKLELTAIYTERKMKKFNTN